MGSPPPQGVTVLIVEQNVNTTLQFADRAYLMDQGRIVESGNHTELLKHKGKYYELYMTQFAGQAI